MHMHSAYPSAHACTHTLRANARPWVDTHRGVWSEDVAEGDRQGYVGSRRVSAPEAGFSRSFRGECVPRRCAVPRAPAHGVVDRNDSFIFLDEAVMRSLRCVALGSVYGSLYMSSGSQRSRHLPGCGVVAPPSGRAHPGMCPLLTGADRGLA